MIPMLWDGVVLMLFGAVMLVVGVGAPVVWIAVITVGLAMTAIDRSQTHGHLH
jgi:hypothetical protein